MYCPLRVVRKRNISQCIVTSRMCCEVKNGCERNIEMMHYSPHTITPTNFHFPQCSKQNRVVDSKLQRSLYHLQKMKYLKSGELARQLELCHWLAPHTHLHQYSLFIGEVQFTHNGVHNRRNSFIVQWKPTCYGGSRFAVSMFY